MPETSHTITVLLRSWKDGGPDAAEQLAEAVYGELHRIASQRLRHERPDHTLQPTALVHEAYLRLLQYRDPGWKGRAEFFAAASGQMRRILVDYARKHRSGKRGGGAVRVKLETADRPVIMIQDEVVAIDQALDRLANLDPQMARIVELRFFGGLTVEETAEVLSLSTDRVERQWTAARAWLASELGAA
jgi:RNA polymerase sigma factor (TIGR02999 family)